MPTYDYRCETNGRTVEVRHSMNERLATWGEICERAGIEPGETHPESPVQRLITGGLYVSSAALKNAEAPSCGTGGCSTGFCGLN